MSNAYNTDGMWTIPGQENNGRIEMPLKASNVPSHLTLGIGRETAAARGYTPSFFGWDSDCRTIANRHNWDNADVARAKRLHKQWKHAKEWAETWAAEINAKRALRIVRKIGGDGKEPTLQERLRLIVQEQRMGVYTPGRRATIWEVADLMKEAEALREDTQAASCGPDACEVIYPDDDMTRRSGLLEDD